MEAQSTQTAVERAILAGVHTGRTDDIFDTTEESIAELGRLAETAGAEVVGELVQNRIAPETATYLGEGKLEELARACETLEADLVIFDSELSPIQIRNLERTLKVRVIDRSMLILDIFARHANTAEGKIQVELAQLQYMLPRLSGMGTQLSRLGGGIGTRGPGESQLETDRRHIRRRIDKLREELKEIKKHRDLLRRQRQRDHVPVAALVGYTNAGKSTLLNRLTDAGVLAEDKLFATLDPTIRAYTLADGRRVYLGDTVGFIRKLPHRLIEAFKSTLEEAVYADVLLHVTDCASPEFDKHIQVVDSILREIGASGKPTILVYNKADSKPPDQILPPRADGVAYTVEVSGKTGAGMDALLAALENILPGKKIPVTLLLPYDQGNIVHMLHERHTVLSESFGAEGSTIEALIDNETYQQLKKYAIKK